MTPGDDNGAGAPDSSSSSFSLGKESTDGTFARQDSWFRNHVTADGTSDFAAEAGRYHLYVSWACPWAHRTIIGRRLKGLEDAIGISYVDPIRDADGWAFTGGEFVDDIDGAGFLSEKYHASDPSFDGRVTVPVLWDTKTNQIVNNESGEILRMFTTAFGELGDSSVDLYPDPQRAEIDELNDLIYDTVNDAVYKAGFSSRQDVYEREVRTLFETLDQLDARLASRRFLFGDHPVETDWRLFTTLVRFDAVYYIHFKVCLRRIVDYPNLWPYLRDLYQQPGVAETVKLDQIRAHYYRTHPMVNPSGLVALMPDVDFDEPSGREHLAAGSTAANQRG